MKAKKTARIVVTLVIGIFLLAAVLLLQPYTADAGIYSADSEVAYKEIWVEHRPWFTGGCEFQDDPTEPNYLEYVHTHSWGTWYVEPLGAWYHNQNQCRKELQFDLTSAELNNAVRAEIYIDLWRNRTSHSMRFRLNGNQVRTPDVGDFASRTPYIGEIPKSELVAGTNVMELWKADAQFHVHDVAIRLYYPTDYDAPTGNLAAIEADNGVFSAAAGGTLEIDGDQLVITATNLSPNTRYVEFHGYYYGYDEDNDGVFHDWHNLGRNNFHPGGVLKSGENPEFPDNGTINHIGTVEPVNGQAVITWDIPHVPAQSDVRFKIRLMDDEGRVRDAAGGVSGTFNLVRSKAVLTFLNPNFEDMALGIKGAQPHQGITIVNIPVDPNFFQEAYMIGAYWNNPWFRVNEEPGNANAFNSQVFPSGADTWELAFTDVDPDHLQQGENEIEFNYIGSGSGHMVEKPGPMIVLKRTNSVGADNNAPILGPISPTAGETFVEQDTSISLDVYDLGVGIDESSIEFYVNGTQRTPDISGGYHQYRLFYEPSSPFNYGQTVTVRVVADDLNGNTMDDSYTFEILPEPTDWNFASDDFNVCALEDSAVSWTYVDPLGETEMYADGEHLVLDVPAGSNYDIWQGNLTAPRLMQPVNNPLEFEMIAKFESPLTEEIQSQGILIEYDDGDLLRLNFQYQTGGPPDRPVRIFGATIEDNGSNATRVHSRWALADKFNNGEAMYLRLERKLMGPGGTPPLQFLVSYKQEGDTNWTPTNQVFEKEMTIKKAGVYAGSDGVGHTAVVDYLFNGISPINPEDAIARYLETNVVGEGVIHSDETCENPRVVEALPQLGWSFDGWSGVYTGPDNPASVDFNHGDQLTATFTRDEYDLDVAVSSIDHTGTETTAGLNQPGPGGRVVRNPDQPFYYYDDQVTLTAVPEPGWAFTGWEGDGAGGVQLSETIVITGNTYVTATFAQQKYQVTVDVSGQGDVTVSPPPDGRDYYLYDEQATLTAVPANSDWTFAGWSGDLTGSENPTTITVTENMTIQANFVDEFLNYLPLVIKP